MITRQVLADKLTDYLCRRISLAELVEWAEKAIMEEEFEEPDLPLLRDIVARLGLGDVPAFGLTWEDCRNYLNQLGYEAKVTVTRLASSQ